MKILFKTIHPAFFYGTMLIYFSLSFYFISRVYQPLYTNYALAGISKIRPSEMSNTAETGCDCETTFKKSYPVIWSGKVIATFAGGEDLGIKRYDQSGKYKQFYVDGNGLYKNDLGEDVRVQGRLIGMTCAYKNTVFKECVGEVEAEKITAY